MKPTIVITGATGAMGRAAVASMLNSGWHVVAACRNMDKMRTLFSDGNDDLELCHLDLSCKASIRAFVDAIKGRPIDALWNNAGTLMHHYCLNDEGMDLTFATNFVGTARLTMGLLPMLNDGASVLSTSSLSCYVSTSHRDFFALPQHRRYRRIQAYADSKMALTLWCQELARREQRLKVNCADPGVVDTDIINLGIPVIDWLCDRLARPLMRSPQQGIQSALAALHSDVSGYLFRNGRALPFPHKMVNLEVASRLYDRMLTLL